jgi:uncharacterized protein DUF1259
MRILLALLSLFSLSFAQTPSKADLEEWQPVAKIIGKAGTLQNGIYKIGLPRTDLDVHIGGTKVEPAAGLGSWMAFTFAETDTICDGDLVLTAGEVNPVISALQAGGIEVTAIHNHLIGEEPQVMYVHFFGKGKWEDLSKTLKSALNTTKTPIATVQAAVVMPDLPDQAVIERNMGKKGNVSGMALQFGFPRPYSIAMHHQGLAPAMGMATAINFQRSPKGVAATGDFVLRESEVQTVVKALRAGGIWVTAMHNHLQDEEPRVVFVHFWAEGAADAVSKSLRAALDLSAGK